MKQPITRITIALVFLAALAVSAGGPRDLHAQQSAVVVGVVDVEKIVRESKAGKSIKAALKKQQDAFEADVNKERKSFRELEKKLLAERESLSPEAFEKKKNDLNKQGDEIEKKLAAQLKSAEERANKAKNKVFDTIAQITQEVATERGMTLVITRSAALVYDATFEITDDVMKKLDSKLPSVKL